MGTPMNLEQLAASGLLSEEAKGAGPNDLVLVVDADAPETAQEELTMMEAALTAPRTSGGAGALANLSAPTLDAALGEDPAINLALFSIPGPSVPREAERALRKGLHCLIFSDNVSVEDEVALKQMGRDKDLLVMGPDCGTAHIGGVGLGFCNVVRPGGIGIVGAAGTGIQEAIAAIDACGGGISCALGTGGRDVSDAVGGLAMIQAIETLSEDAETDVLLVLGKPPEPAAMGNGCREAAHARSPSSPISSAAIARTSLRMPVFTRRIRWLKRGGSPSRWAVGAPTLRRLFSTPKRERESLYGAALATVTAGSCEASIRAGRFAPRRRPSSEGRFRGFAPTRLSTRARAQWPTP